MNPYLAIALAALIVGWLLSLVADGLNLRRLFPALPEEFSGWYDADRYRKSQEYLQETTRLSLLAETVFTVLTVVFILLGGFNAADEAARGLGWGLVPTGLVFVFILGLLVQAVQIPFRVYRVFVIEEKYGFNRMTLKTFILDLLKGALLAAILGGIMLSAAIAIFSGFGAFAWLLCWAALAVFQIFVVFIAPVTILPLFNKFTPLEPGELKTAIEEYARSRRFRMKGIFTMDASRRSSKSNAFFTGFGSFKRIVLFDTLLKKMKTPEIVSVLGHEMGHFRRKHILVLTAWGLATQGLMLFLLSRFIAASGLFSAFRMENPSVYAGLVLFGFIAAPLLFVSGVLEHIVSRRHERAADRDGAATPYGAEAFIASLKKLSVDNLSNLTPHPLKVFLEYSHPPVLERIRRLDNRSPR